MLRLFQKFWDLAALSPRLEGWGVVAEVAATGATGQGRQARVCWGTRNGQRGASRALHKDSLTHNTNKRREEEDQGQCGFWHCGEARQANSRGSE